LILEIRKVEVEAGGSGVLKSPEVLPKYYEHREICFLVFFGLYLFLTEIPGGGEERKSLRRRGKLEKTCERKGRGTLGLEKTSKNNKGQPGHLFGMF
jgi:hypothetical protein